MSGGGEDDPRMSQPKRPAPSVLSTAGRQSIIDQMFWGLMDYAWQTWRGINGFGNNGPSDPNIIGGSGPGASFMRGGAGALSQLLKAGNALDRAGLTAVGRALQKHGSRAGSVFPKATGNPASINAQGEAILKGILTNPNTSSTIRHHARLGNVLEYRIPGGQGARFSADGKNFIGFIEP